MKISKNDAISKYDVVRSKNGYFIMLDGKIILEVPSLQEAEEWLRENDKLRYNSDSIQDVSPRSGESQEEFISRFMRETKNEYPDEKQRLAVAYSYWNRAKDSLKDTKYITTPRGTFEVLEGYDLNKAEDAGYVYSHFNADRTYAIVVKRRQKQVSAYAVKVKYAPGEVITVNGKKFKIYNVRWKPRWGYSILVDDPSWNGKNPNSKQAWTTPMGLYRETMNDEQPKYRVGQLVPYKGKKVKIVKVDWDPEYGYDLLVENPNWDGKDIRFKNIYIGDPLALSDEKEIKDVINVYDIKWIDKTHNKRHHMESKDYSLKECLESLSNYVTIYGIGAENTEIVSISKNGRPLNYSGKLSDLLKKDIRDDEESEIEKLIAEEEQAIEDYKKAIFESKDDDKMNLYAHILREEIEHLKELTEAKEIKDATQKLVIFRIIFYEGPKAIWSGPDENVDSRIIAGLNPASACKNLLSVAPRLKNAKILLIGYKGGARVFPKFRGKTIEEGTRLTNPSDWYMGYE